MSAEAVYWLMTVRAEDVSFLAYDDGEQIAMLRLGDALYEVTYGDVEACIAFPTDQLAFQLRHRGRLISGLSVMEQPPIPAMQPFEPPVEQRPEQPLEPNSGFLRPAPGDRLVG